MIYSILLYAVFILPISIWYYKKDGKKWLFIKIINSLITLYVFIAVAGNLRRLVLGFSDNSYLIMKDVPFGLNVSVSILYAILSIIAGVQTIRLAFRKENARSFFLWLLPFLWIFTGIDKYYAYISLYNEGPSLLYIILSNIAYTLLWICIFLFYNSKKLKLFFKVPLTVN
jgi:hypothetical protein